LLRLLGSLDDRMRAEAVFSIAGQDASDA
jgi:hypothetical protein